MRLLNTSTYTLTEFQSDIPSYAILSHMWQMEEVTFQDIATLHKAKNKRGFTKIVGACNIAKRDGFEYIWIDTCCINKESSAELSEAVNSMYTWYKNAHVCYAYLWDVPSENHRPLFAVSLWFTRGWTLQELIAPRRVVFYGADWVDIGTKASLHEAISTITGISTEVITGEISLGDVSVAVRMSWAADRNTTRKEDVAYSLMGIFDIHMPLLYGEGEKAFIRLQHEIIKKSNDHSIFAWTALVHIGTDRGILAGSPREFHRSGEVERIPPASLGSTQPNNHIMNSPPPYAITNQGLHIELPIVVVRGETLALLNCRLSGKSDPIAITLVWSHHLQQYMRSEKTQLERTVRGSARLSSLYIADYYETHSDPWMPIKFKLNIKVPPDYKVPKIIPNNFSQTGESLQFASDLSPGEAGLLVFNELEPFAVVIGARDLGVAWCGILTDVKPVGQSDDQIVASYRAASDTRWATKGPFLDRASTSLANGWSVTVSLTSSSDLASGFPTPGFRTPRFHGKVEITKSLGQQYPVPLNNLLWGTTYLVVLPAPQHGFVVDTNYLRKAPPKTSRVQHFHSFILLTSDARLEELQFENVSTKEGFYLVLESVSQYHFNSSIERESVLGRSRFEGRSGNNAGTYSAILGNGKSVFVTQRRCRDRSLAHYVITMSM